VRLYVLARNYQDFKRWCWEKGIPELHATYVAHPERLHGATLTDRQIIRVPGYEDNINHGAIMEQIEHRLAVSA
jgi:hypothetical protein